LGLSVLIDPPGLPQTDAMLLRPTSNKLYPTTIGAIRLCSINLRPHRTMAVIKSRGRLVDTLSDRMSQAIGCSRSASVCGIAQAVILRAGTKA